MSYGLVAADGPLVVLRVFVLFLLLTFSVFRLLWFEGNLWLRAKQPSKAMVVF